MTDSSTQPSCAVCGGPLGERDVDRGTCHDCRSPAGKIADLDIAIRASGDSPERIRDWPVIRHLLRKRFGENRADLELWERCTDWLRAEGRLTPNDYLGLPLDYLQWLLENGFAQKTESSSDEWLEALRTVQRELENWNRSSSPSETGYVVEDVPVGHPLHAAVVALQPFYGGALQKPALGHWRTFLKLAGNGDEAAETTLGRGSKERERPMSPEPPPKCDLCRVHAVKVFAAQYGEQIVDVCGRCHRRIRRQTTKPKRRDLPGQLKFSFMEEK
jgi:hypothetical protein